jgi:hypothetical protein
MSDEESKAKAAASAGPAAGKTLFQRIIDREIPADIIYEDEHVRNVHVFCCRKEMVLWPVLLVERIVI